MADKGVREALAQTMHDTEPRGWLYIADALLSGPVAPLLAELEALRGERDQVLALLDRLAEDTDDVPCRYDHHGACQEHGGGSEEPGDCTHRTAHELLKRVGLR